MVSLLDFFRRRPGRMPETRLLCQPSKKTKPCIFVGFNILFFLAVWIHSLSNISSFFEHFAEIDYELIPHHLFLLFGHVLDRNVKRIPGKLQPFLCRFEICFFLHSSYSQVAPKKGRVPLTISQHPKSKGQCIIMPPLTSPGDNTRIKTLGTLSQA